MRKVIAAAALLALGAGCSNSGSEDLGGLKANLTLPSGTVINSINYSITGGPSAVTENGIAPVANSATAQFRVGNLPAGGGYSIALAATTVAGATCAGTGTFAVTANTFTGLTMNLYCGDGVVVDTNPDGDLEVDISVIEQALTCPVAGGITALPTEVYVGFDIALQGFATGSTGATPTQTAATYGWSGPGGTFSAASALSTNYTCVTAGDHTINFTVSKQGCADSVMPVILTCTGAPTGGTAGVGGTGGTAGDAGTGGTGGTAGDAGTGGTGGVGGTGGTGGAPATGFELLSASCRACAQANYTMDVAGEDVYGKCFGTVESPAFAQACVDAFVCSTLADDGAPGRGDDCGQNDINGAITCYCGQPYNEANCTNDSIGPQGECQNAWEIATNCDSITDVSDRANCVLNNFSDFAVPAGIASYGVVLQQGACSAECLADYNGFTGTYPTEL